MKTPRSKHGISSPNEVPSAHSTEATKETRAKRASIKGSTISSSEIPSSRTSRSDSRITSKNVSKEVSESKRTRDRRARSVGSPNVSGRAKAETKRVESSPIGVIKAILFPNKSTKKKKKRTRSAVRLAVECPTDGSSQFIRAPQFSVISLNCPAKNYEWGKFGSNSFVGQILKDQGTKIDEDKPYAELWMGTHKSGSSCIRGLSPDLDGHPLTDLFSAFPEFIGDMNIHQKYGQQLPFLFKVLSVNKPLSIQVHPDKSLAGQLFSTRPEHYPDANHKPEMAIALTPFSALAYFRPHDQIINCIKKYEQLAQLIGKDLVIEYESAPENDRRECLKKCFITLLTKSPGHVIETINQLIGRANNDRNDEVLKIFKQIADHYPGDVGTFACFFLNHIKLEPGQALFIGVNQPHCYLSGDCIEIMACSDNVIRAGLTPKFKDVELLCATMKYKPKPIEEIILKPVCKNEFICLYAPPVDEFAIEKIEIPADRSPGLQYPLEGLHSASLLIIIDCEGAIINSVANLRKSSIYFLPPGLNYTLSDISGRFLAFRAFIRK